MSPPYQENDETNMTWELSAGKNYNACHIVDLQSDFLKYKINK